MAEMRSRDNIGKKKPRHAAGAKVTFARPNLTGHGDEVASARWARLACYRFTVLEIADIGSEGLHLANALVDPFKVLHDPIERFAKPGLKGGLQLLVNGLPHLVELGRILLPNRVKAALNGGPQ
jgi:hypothetical protein